MDANTLSIASSITSLVLAAIAIWQAVYFYTQAKNTETRVETTLASINAQVQTLQSINAKTLDRLTKYATTPRDEPSTQLVQALSTSIEQSDLTPPRQLAASFWHPAPRHAYAIARQPA